MSDLLRLKVGNSSYLVKWKPPFKQGWTEDSNVTTSLGNKIPVEDCGIEMSLQSVSEMPYMHTVEDNCGIEMSLISIEPITDTTTIGGRTYRIIKMPDGKEWLAENLDYAWSGLSVPTTGAGTSANPQAMYYLYNESTYGWNGYKCGLLYNWYAVKYLEDNKASLIPGWHVPSNDEWDALAEAIGGTSTAGRKLKALDNSAGSNWPSSWNGTDDYGFSVLPAGYYNSSGFYQVNVNGYYWTATEYNSNEARTKTFNTNAGIISNSWTKKNQYSVRLVKDTN